MPDLPIAVATIVVSLMLLMYSADHLVRGASSLATRIGVSALFTGMVVVGAATSAPEMATTVVAAADGAFGIAVGNIVGSNIANLALVLGVAGAMAPIRVSRAVFRRDGSMLVAASIALMGVALLPQPIVGRLAGIGALIALSLYTMYAFHGERNLKAVVDELERAAEEILHPDPLLVAIIRSAASLVLLVISAGLFVDNARAIGSALGVPESVLGLTVAAIGTSLPELAATIAGMLRKRSDVVLGNILGSCLFNLLAIGGVAAIIAPLTIPADIARIDIPIMLGITIMTAIFIANGMRLSRLEGVTLLASYGVFLVVQFTRIQPA